MPNPETGWVHRLREKPDLEVVAGRHDRLVTEGATRFGTLDVLVLRCLAADPAALEQEHIGAPLGEKVGTGRADDPTAHDRDVTGGTGQEEPEVFMGGSTDRR